MYRFLGGAVTIATIGVLALSASGVFAAAPTYMSDTLSREKINEASVNHDVKMTLGTALTGAMTLTYQDFSAFAGSGSATCGTSGTATYSAASNVLTVTGAAVNQ